MTFQSDFWLLLWIGLVALVAYSAKLKRKETVLGQETERYSLLFAVIVFLPIFLLTSFGQLRADGWAYANSFKSLDKSFSGVFQNWWNVKGPGFSFLEVFIKSIFGNNLTAYRLIIALIQSIPLVLIYRKFSEDYIMSVFLFISMLYYSWMFNGMRQFVAACIIFATLPLLLKKRIIITILIILLAITIHSSAMMMIPIIIVVYFKPWGKGIIFSYIVFVIALFVFVNNTNLIDIEILQKDNGSNPIRIFISAIPCVIAFIGRKSIEKQNNRLINICVNMSMFTTLIYLVATFTNGIGTGRLPVYTGLFNLILIPYLCKRVFNETISKNLKIYWVVFYTAYYFYAINVV